MNAQTARRCSVFLADDHPLVRQGLALLLAEEGFQVCGEAGSPETMFGHPALSSAGAIILDLSLGPANGADLLAALRQRGLTVVVCSMNEDASSVRRAFAAGAAGYVTKREAVACLIPALLAVHAGKVYASPRAAAALAAGPALIK